MTPPAVSPAWSALTPGTSLTIVKQAPDGQEVTRYPGHVFLQVEEGSWIGAQATWTNRAIDVDGLWFHPGDTIEEYFSATEWFNAFRVLAPGGEARGWYANVTYPTKLEVGPAGLLLLWHDLYVDIVVRQDGGTTVRDEDELADSALAERAPDIHRNILAARDLILTRIEQQIFPFDQQGPV